MGIDIKMWGCAKNKQADGYWARDGIMISPSMRTKEGDPVGVYRMVWVPYRMSRECRYDKRDDDWRCRGCTRERVTTE